MTDCSALLVELRRLDIKLQLREGKLAINAPKGVLSPELQQTLKDNRQALIEFLQSSQLEQQAEELQIPQLERNAALPLSLAQVRLWYIEQLSPGLTAFNIPLEFSLTGKVDPQLLSKAINTIVSRHEALRTVFPVTPDQVQQQVLEQLLIELPLVDLRATADAQQQLLEYTASLLAQPFDLARGPLLRCSLFALSDQQWHLYLCFHHMIFDGSSIELFIAELHEIYDALQQQRRASLPELPIHYADYAAWHRQWVEHTVVPQQMDYWLQTLSELPDPLPLPFDFPRPAQQSYAGDTVSLHLPESCAQSLLALGTTQQASLFMVMLACLKITLYKYTDCSDIVIGTMVANRPLESLRNLLGYFANTQVTRTRFDTSASVRQAIGAVRDSCLGADEHQDLPFEQLVAALHPERDPSRTPIFQILFNYSDIRSLSPASGSLQLEPVARGRSTARTDLAIDVFRSDQGMLIEFEYATALFARETIEQFAQHLRQLAESLADNAEVALQDLRLLSDSELAAMHSDHRQHRRDYPAALLLPALIDTSVQNQGEKTAVVSGSRSLSYRELAGLSDRFALYLQEQGLGRGSAVGLCVARSEWLPVMLLGVFKSGCAYIPLDPDFPAARLDYMIEDSGLQYLITEQALASRFNADVKPLLLEQFQASLSATLDTTTAGQAHALAQLPAADDPAYIIYTSGTTGQPKGVVVAHAAVANFIQGMIEKPGLAASDCLLAVTTLSFDISVLELFLPLAVGATTVIAGRNESGDGRRLLELIKTQRVNVMQATPATWRMLLASGWNADLPLKVLCGGEALPADLAQQIVQSGSELWNMYGPTETTVWSSCQRIDDDAGPVSLGKPVANTRLYICAQGGALMPRGAGGELCIAGAGVAQGYHNKPALTAERFVSDPLYPAHTMYRTGDKARYRRDGSLEYLGRMDNQVKLRGYRVELGDIEYALNQHPAVAECAVAIRQRGSNDSRLVAFVVWQQEAATLTDIRKFLNQRLPKYMIPQLIVELSALPRTPNEKIDRKALPLEYSGITNDAEYQAPVSPTQCWIAELWESTIGVGKISLTDNFFDVGGHSLLSLGVVAALNQQFAADISHRDILQENLQTIAAKIDAVNAGT